MSTALTHRNVRFHDNSPEDQCPPWARCCRHQAALSVGFGDYSIDGVVTGVGRGRTDAYVIAPDNKPTSFVRILVAVRVGIERPLGPAERDQPALGLLVQIL